MEGQADKLLRRENYRHERWMGFQPQALLLEQLEVRFFFFICCVCIYVRDSECAKLSACLRMRCVCCGGA
jgi:hypothetical protein